MSNNEIEKTENNGNVSDGYHTFNELYEHRHALLMALANAVPKSFYKSKKHFDGSMFDDYFIVVGFYFERGQYIEFSYHVPIKYWSSFAIEEREKACPWDGHSSQDAVERLRAFAMLMRINNWSDINETD